MTHSLKKWSKKFQKTQKIVNKKSNSHQNVNKPRKKKDYQVEHSKVKRESFFSLQQVKFHNLRNRVWSTHHRVTRWNDFMCIHLSSCCSPPHICTPLMAWSRPQYMSIAIGRFPTQRVSVKLWRRCESRAMLMWTISISHWNLTIHSVPMLTILFGLTRRRALSTWTRAWKAWYVELYFPVTCKNQKISIPDLFWKKEV